MSRPGFSLVIVALAVAGVHLPLLHIGRQMLSVARYLMTYPRVSGRHAYESYTTQYTYTAWDQC